MSKTIKVRMVNDPVEVMRYEPGKRALKVAKFLVAQGAPRVEFTVYRDGEFVITGPIGEPLPAGSYVGYGNPTADPRRSDDVFAVCKEALAGWVNPSVGTLPTLARPRADRGFEEVV